MAFGKTRIGRTEIYQALTQVAPDSACAIRGATYFEGAKNDLVANCLQMGGAMRQHLSCVLNVASRAGSEQLACRSNTTFSFTAGQSSNRERMAGITVLG